MTSAVLVFPLFIIYQLGILGGRGQNGADILTQALVGLAHRSVSQYVAILGGLLAVYTAVVAVLHRRGSFSPRAFIPTVLESSCYALTMGSLIVLVMQKFVGVLPGLALAPPNPLDTLVISAGAGFYEELVFRVILMGAMAWLFTGITGPRRASILALVASSLLFSLAHHLGPTGEAFRFAAFTYRAMAGVFFAVVYRVRGFAVAAWTHALYDLFVLSAGE